MRKKVIFVLICIGVCLSQAAPEAEGETESESESESEGEAEGGAEGEGASAAATGEANTDCYSSFGCFGVPAKCESSGDCNAMVMYQHKPDDEKFHFKIEV